MSKESKNKCWIPIHSLRHLVMPKHSRTTILQDLVNSSKSTLMNLVKSCTHRFHNIFLKNQELCSSCLMKEISISFISSWLHKNMQPNISYTKPSIITMLTKVMSIKFQAWTTKKSLPSHSNAWRILALPHLKSNKLSKFLLQSSIWEILSLTLAKKDLSLSQKMSMLQISATILV